eukprot:CAMPEP_0201966200 /NCGR_PEP_ID=MMETSP0904-20121228/11274_1 /ASSEMBLY_ACC=CAM_ASM_000553 /TAXON_ID=420261 /ORGANISM="Thalassiosira antarctica, Strain CCMP982" /LENGTH=261 /DNA_ID=CAMNT_0048513413 /DNA_START=133 /DNA_END=918 /DNA_ORIENTATION=-
MVSVHRDRSLHRSSKKMTLSATDQFWYSPIIQVIPSTSDTSTSDDDDEFMVMSLPPAHNQLLSQDHVSSESLKGYDHTQDVIGHDNLDGYGSDESSFCCRQKLSAVKQQGGGSWLLGFARFNDKTVTVLQPQAEEDMTPPGLLRVPSGSYLESDEYSSSDDDSASGDSLPSNDDSKKRPRGRGVSFSPTVKVQPIPHSSTLSSIQRRKMYSTSVEVRQNKTRNKKEYRYDGNDWRNITDESMMDENMATGELVHPVHAYCL